MRSWKHIVPAPLRPAARWLYHAAYRRKLAFEWRWRAWRESKDAAARNLPPPHLRFRVGESSDPREFLEVGRRTAENIVGIAERHGVDLQGAVLDFGCGCGRTLRWMIERYPSCSWHGCDVDAEAVAWCREHLGGTFVENGHRPPLPFDGASFDVVYGISVFTHLNEDDQRAWARELARILKPDGVLLLSFYGEHVWKATPDARAVETGGFVFRESSKLKGIVPDWYHTAFQTPERMLDVLHVFFERVERIPRGFGDHDAALARRPVRGVHGVPHFF